MIALRSANELEFICGNLSHGGGRLRILPSSTHTLSSISILLDRVVRI